MRLRWLLLLALLMPNQAWAAITCTTTDFNTGLGTASTTLAVTETIPAQTNRRTILAVQNRSDESTTISSVADDNGGTWTLRQGPTPAANTTIYTWFYERDNTNTGATTATVTFSGAINSVGIMGTCYSDTASLDYVSSATVVDYATGGGATVTSNTRTFTNTGVLICDQNSSGNSAISSVGTNQTAMNTASFPVHIDTRLESSGAFSCDITLTFAVNGTIGAHLYQEASSAAQTFGFRLRVAQ